MARVRVLLRRPPAAAGHVLAVGAAEFDLINRTVTTDDSAATLSGRESDLLRLLAENPSRVFTRHEIVAEVFPESNTDTLADTYVHYLRRKLGASVVTTVRGTGYRLGRL
jgi:two-component system response regulator QseB